MSVQTFIIVFILFLLFEKLRMICMNDSQVCELVAKEDLLSHLQWRMLLKFWLNIVLLFFISFFEISFLCYECLQLWE